MNAILDMCINALDFDDTPLNDYQRSVLASALRSHKLLLETKADKEFVEEYKIKGVGSCARSLKEAGLRYGPLHTLPRGKRCRDCRFFALCNNVIAGHSQTEKFCRWSAFSFVQNEQNNLRIIKRRESDAAEQLFGHCVDAIGYAKKDLDNAQKRQLAECLISYGMEAQTEDTVREWRQKLIKVGLQICYGPHKNNNMMAIPLRIGWKFLFFGHHKTKGVK
jgi:hypothetical protein